MGAVFFYHLTESPIEATLPVLLQKARGAGWRVVVRGTDTERLGWLDEGFLPHALAGGPRDARQPILLTDGPGRPNEAACLMAIDGAEIAPGEVDELERVCILFDGHDPAAVARARDQWRSLTGAGKAAEYWAQEAGRWQKKASSGA